MPLAAIVLDVDGTLLTSQHRITSGTHAAIRRARAAGVRVMLASARGPGALRPIADELGLSAPLIAYGGALVCDTQADGFALRFERRLPGSVARQAVATAAALGLEIGWHAGARWYAPAAGEALRREAAITGERLEPLGDPARREEPHKLLCIAGRREQLPALAEMRRSLPPDCHAQLSHRNYLEIVASAVDKATALERLCAELEIDLVDVAAIGDGENDITLLRRAGIGIAMAHAVAPVREAADWVTDTNDRDGVALAIGGLLARDRAAI